MQIKNLSSAQTFGTVIASLPDDMREYSAEINIDGTKIHLKVLRSAPAGLTVDGVCAQSIPLDGREHSAELRYLV